jgi:hypothetical protein
MSTDVRWAFRALRRLVIDHDYDGAIAESGPEHVRFLARALDHAVHTPELSLPDQPGFAAYLTHLQEGIEREFGPLDAPDPSLDQPGTKVTMTDDWDTRPWRPTFPGRRRTRGQEPRR